MAVVCGIGVSGEGKWSVSRVLMLKITSKIPESAIMGGHYIREFLDEVLGCFGCRRHIVDEGKSHDILAD